MKKRLLAMLLSVAMTTSALGAEDVTQTMFYVKVPLGGSTAAERASSVGFMLKPAARPGLDFSFTPRAAYRRNAAEADPFDAADFNWWLIGGLTAAALLLIASSRKASKDEPPPCQVSGNCGP